MTDIQATARWTAAARAMETSRSDAIFHDPWAADLAGDEGRRWVEARSAGSLMPMIVRTRYFDDFLVEATAAGRVTQVVLIAAGLDTRALRLAWPAGTSVFEVDQPDVIRQKEEVLGRSGASPRSARLVRLPADLDGVLWPGQLLDAGLDPQAPAAWLAEGFLFYLDGDAIAALLERLSGLAAAGSVLGFDIPDRTVFTHPVTRPWIEMQAAAGAPWIGTIDDPKAHLAAIGWEAVVTQCGAADAHYGRWPLPVGSAVARDLPQHRLVTARKRDRP
ncbi:MAG: SAM-dependent methyltransferase [Candidatus Dormibacteria bacterium]|jgi:methyltransferase (TIGR00027 family)